MDYSRQLREAEERIKRELRQEFANMIQVTTVSRSTATGNEDGAEGWPEAGESYERKPRRVQHFGFRSVPPKGDGEIMLLVGGGGAAEVTIGEYGENFGPTNLAEGDAALYSSKAGCTIVADANGAITITVPAAQLIKAGGSTDFAVRGSTYRSAEDTLLTAFSVLFTAIGTFATAVGVAVPGVAGAATTLNTAITTANAAITTFKAGTYLSTINKLG